MEDNKDTTEEPQPFTTTITDGPLADSWQEAPQTEQTTIPIEITGENQIIDITDIKTEEIVPIEPKPTGRPSAYTKELADKICAELAMGKSLRTVCAPDEMPCVATIFNWFRAYPDFLEQYARAKEESADAMADEMLDIADDGTNDYMTITKGNVSYNVEDREVTNRSKLRVDTRKWIAAKLKPKKYGDKVDLTSGGEAIKSNSIVFTDFKNNGTETESK